MLVATVARVAEILHAARTLVEGRTGQAVRLKADDTMLRVSLIATTILTSKFLRDRLFLRMERSLGILRV